MRVLGFGTYDVLSHPRVGILLTGLAQNGNSVAELNRPLGIGTAGRVAALASPRAALRFAGRLLSRWFALIRGSLRWRGSRAPEVILVGYLGHFDVLLARMLFPRATIALDHLIFAADTAADRRLGGGVKTRLLRGLDRLALSCASVIILDTAAHEELVPASLRERVVVPVGAPDEWFDARRNPGAWLVERSDDADDAAHSSVRPPSIVFFGLFTPLQGTPTIARALRILDEKGLACEVTLVGSGQDEPECREILGTLTGAVRVTWRSWVPAGELPAAVAEHDICLGIFGTSAKAGRVVPNKAYQGMAAGCCLVTSDTPAQREMLKVAHFVPAGDARALASELEQLFGDPGELARARRACAERADEAFRPATVTRALVHALERAILRKGRTP